MLENDKLVSIIVPAYNAEKTIDRCINSLLNQTYQNLEIIVINDGSKDKTLDEILKYNDKRLKVFNQENKGVANTRNKGLSEANGDFIAFCDSDDFYNPNFVEEIVKNFSENVCMVSCGFTNSKTVTKGEIKTKEFQLTQAIEELFSDKYLFVYMCNKVLRKEFLKELRFNEKIKNFGEDVCFWYNYLKSCPPECKVIHIKNKLYHYIIRRGSESSIKTKNIEFPKSKLYFIRTLEEMAEKEKKQGNNKIAQRINAWLFLILIQFMLETKKHNINLYNEFRKIAKEKLTEYKKCRQTYKNFRRYGGLYYLFV